MISFLGTPKVQYFDDNGNPLATGVLFVFLPGTTTKTNSYPTIADAIAGTNANPNPVPLDARGEANVVLTRAVKLVLTTDDDEDPPTSPIWTEDNYYTPNTVLDNNGNELLDFTAVSNAVNYVNITNSAAGNPAIVAATGSDSNVELLLKGKGTLGARILTGSANTFYITQGTDPTINAIFSLANLTADRIFTFQNVPGTLTLQNSTGIIDSAGNVLLGYGVTGSAVNYPVVVNSAAGNPARLGAAGSDTNVTLDLFTKGSGVFRFFSGTGAEVQQWYNSGTSGAEIAHTMSAVTAKRTITWPDLDVAIIGAGSATDQETATSTSVAVTPAIQQRHPSACKAWALFNGTGTAAVLASYNVTSLTDNGTGDYTITYTTAFSSVGNSVSITAKDTLGAGYNNTTGIAAGSVRMIIYTTASSPTASDSALVSVQSYGDQ